MIARYPTLLVALCLVIAAEGLVAAAAAQTPASSGDGWGEVPHSCG